MTKFEKGDIVRFRDGVDEWRVTNPYHRAATIALGGDTLHVENHRLHLVRRAEPPKPDYYVNVPGEPEPKNGDVFASRGDIVFVSGDRYFYTHQCRARVEAYPYSLSNADHRIGDTRYSRTLIARDGEPFPG